MEGIRSQSPVQVRSPYEAALARAAAPASSLAPASCAPQDSAHLAASGPAAGSELPAAPRRRTLLQKLALYGITSVVGGTSLMGGVAWQQVSSALGTPTTVSNTLAPLPGGAPAGLGTVPGGVLVTAPSSSPSSAPVLTEATARKLFDSLQNSPEVQKQLDARVNEVRTHVAQELSHLPAVEQTDLVDVRAPLPTGEASFLHVGPVSLPSFGWHDLQPESIPMVAKSHLELGAVKVGVDVKPTWVPEAQRPAGPPGAVYLGSFCTTVKPDALSVTVQGKIDLRLDLDGAAAREALQSMRQEASRVDPGSPRGQAVQENIRRLQQRVADGAGLQERLLARGFDSTLKGIMADQGAAVKLDLPLRSGAPLVQGHHHVWLAAGGLDAAPRVVLTGELATPALDAIQVPAPRLGALPHDAKGEWTAETLRNLVKEKIQEQVGKSFQGASSEIPGRARVMVDAKWTQTTSELERAANTALKNVYDGVTRLDVQVRPSVQAVPAAGAGVRSAAGESLSLAPAPVTASPLPEKALRGVYQGLQRSEVFQQELQARIAAVRSQVQEQFAHTTIRQQELVDLRITPPAELAGMLGQDSITVPVVVEKTASPSAVPLRIDVAALDLEGSQKPAGEPGMVYLGSYRTTVRVDAPTIHVEGQGRIRADLDGSATRSELQRWQEEARHERADSPRGKAIQANVERLHQRLEGGAKLAGMAQRFGVSGELSQLMTDQGVQIAMDVSVPRDVPLLQGTHHVWAAPSGRADGVPRLVITDTLATPGIDGLRAGEALLSPLPHTPLPGETGALQQVHGMLQQRVQQEAGKMLEGVRADLPEQARGQVQQLWRESVTQIQAATNQALQDAVRGLADAHAERTILPVGSPTPPRFDPTRAAGPTSHAPSIGAASRATTAAPTASMMMVLPGDTLGVMVKQVNASPEMHGQLEKARLDVEQRLRHPAALDQEELMDVHVSLPGFDLRVPLVVKQHVQPDGLAGKVHVTPEVLSGAARPPAPEGTVYLGSYRSEVWAQQATLGIHGRAQVSVDLEGTSTRAALDEWQGRLRVADVRAPEGRAVQANVERLQVRLDAIQQLRGMGSAPEARAALEALGRQAMDVQGVVTLPTDAPLVKGVHHVFVGRDGVRITDRLETGGIERARLADATLTPLAHPVPAGMEKIQDLITQRLASEGQKMLGQVSAEVPIRVRAAAEKSWSDARPMVQKAGDDALATFYRTHAGMQLALGSGPLGGTVVTSVTGVMPMPNGDLAVMLGFASGGQQVMTPHLATLDPSGGIDSVMSGEALNHLLQDRSDGGSVDWDKTLQETARAKGLKSLAFTCDAQGHLNSPRLAWQDGRPYAVFEVAVQMGGLRPVAGTTGLLTGGTGWLDSGAGAVKDGLGKVAGTPGKVVGSVVQAPFTLLDMISGGLKHVVDGTVGRVVDALPEAGTRPGVAVRIDVPLKMEVHEGVLAVAPQAEGLKVSEATGSSGHLVLPTNIIQSAVAQAVANGGGAQEQLHGAVSGMGMNLDLRDQGLHFKDAEVMAPQAGSDAPDLRVHLELGSGFDINHFQAR